MCKPFGDIFFMANTIYISRNNRNFFTEVIGFLTKTKNPFNLKS